MKKKKCHRHKIKFIFKPTFLDDPGHSYALYRCTAKKKKIQKTLIASLGSYSVSPIMRYDLLD